MGPTRDAPERPFYVYAPTIHWHTVSSAAEDEPARRVIERLADEAYRFGQQTEEYEHRLLEGQQGLEEFVLQERRSKDEMLASVQGSVQHMQTETAAMGDVVRLLRVRSNQVENAAQEAEQRQQKNTERLQNRMETYQQENREAKEAMNK